MLTQQQIEARLKEDKRKIDYLLYLQSQGGTPGTGTVTSVSVTPANGFTGTVTSPGSTPAITLATSVTGILQGNGTAISGITNSSTVGQVLTVTGASTYAWATPTGGMTNPLTTTGDIIYSSSGTTPARLGIGATNEFLTVQGGVPVWDSINLVVTGVGTGEPVLYDTGTDVLFHKALLDSTFISITPVSDDLVFALSATGTPTAAKVLYGDNTWRSIEPTIGSTASSATPTPAATDDQFNVTALAVNAVFAAPTGTPADGHALIIRIKDDGTIRTLGWNAIYRAGAEIALPTATVASETIYVQFMYNGADTVWDLVGLTQAIS